MDSDGRFSKDDDFTAKAYAIGGKILLAAIAILFTAVLFFIGLHIYIRCFWRGGSFRRRRMAFAGRVNPARHQRVGLEKSVIEALPVFAYRAENREDGTGLECAVCLCEFEENEKVRLLPKCNHSFHVDCIGMWFDSNSTCPLCRTTARPDPQPSEADGAGSVAVGETSGTAGEEQASAVSITVDGNREGDLYDSQNQGDLCDSQNRISLRPNLNLVEGTSSPKPLERIVVDIPPRRPDSFSSPRVSMTEDQHLVSPGGQSSLSTRLHSFRRILSRVAPQSPRDGSVHMIEQGGPAKV